MLPMYTMHAVYLHDWAYSWSSVSNIILLILDGQKIEGFFGLHHGTSLS